MRDLEKKDDIKEFNHLRITNLDEFFESYMNHWDIYLPPWQVLAQLEEEIKYDNELPSTVTIDYKDSGQVLFDYQGTKEEQRLRIVEYSYWGTAS